MRCVSESSKRLRMGGGGGGERKISYEIAGSGNQQPCYISSVLFVFGYLMDFQSPHIF